MLHFVLIFLALVAAGLAVALYCAGRAPVGHEDEEGFHLAPESVKPPKPAGQKTKASPGVVPRPAATYRNAIPQVSR